MISKQFEKTINIYSLLLKDLEITSTQKLPMPMKVEVHHGLKINIKWNMKKIHNNPMNIECKNVTKSNGDED